MFCFVRFYTASSTDKHQSSSQSSGSQQDQSHSSVSNSLSATLSYDDKTEPKEPVSKYGRRFNHPSSGRQYQVSCLVVLFLRMLSGILFSYLLLCNIIMCSCVIITFAYLLETFLMNC